VLGQLHALSRFATAEGAEDLALPATACSRHHPPRTRFGAAISSGPARFGDSPGMADLVSHLLGNAVLPVVFAFGILGRRLASRVRDANSRPPKLQRASGMETDTEIHRLRAGGQSGGGALDALLARFGRFPRSMTRSSIAPWLAKSELSDRHLEAYSLRRDRGRRAQRAGME
jgi:hypothetical protein